MDLACSAGITKIAIKATEDDGIVTRTVRMTLAREFDWLISSAIGGDASTLREALMQHSCSKVEIPIDAISGECRLIGERGEEVLVKMVSGVKAVGKAGKADDADPAPTVELIFDFPFQLAAWDFFGKNVGGRAEVTFTKQQLDLPGTEKTPAAGKEKPRGTVLERAVDTIVGATAGGGTLSAIGLDGKKTVIAKDGERVGPAPAETEEQAAASPEEAESLRAARLEQERAAAAPATYSKAVTARVDAHLEEAKATKFAKEGGGSFWVAVFKTPTHRMEADGDNKAGAIRALRDKMLVEYSAQEARLVNGGGLKNGGLKPPSTNGDGKTRRTSDEAQAPADDDGPLCPPGCDTAHVHSIERAAF